MKICRFPIARTLAALFALGVTLGLVGATSEAFAQGNAPLVGVWGVTVTARNCSTGAPLGPPTRAVVTFHQDGTLFESIILLLFAPDQRTLGHGTWTQSGGATYVDKTLVLVGFDTPPNTPPGSPGFPAGWIASSSTITLSTADRFESTGATRFYDTNRQEYRPQTCATRVGERFK